jgi:hypothetical protein
MKLNDLPEIGFDRQKNAYPHSPTDQAQREPRSLQSSSRTHSHLHGWPAQSVGPLSVRRNQEPRPDRVAHPRGLVLIHASPASPKRRRTPTPLIPMITALFVQFRTRPEWRPRCTNLPNPAQSRTTGASPQPLTPSPGARSAPSPPLAFSREFSHHHIPQATTKG